MTPSELKKIKSAVAAAAADLFARDTNADTDAETMAEELAEAMTEAMVSMYEEIQAKSYNLVLVARFQIGDEAPHLAAVGPLSTRAKQRARDVGERFAWDYKTRTGHGQYALVPLVRSPNEAWDAARKKQEGKKGVSVTPGEGPSYEAMRFDLTEEQRAAICADWDIDPKILEEKFGPACRCGKRRTAWRAEGGGVDDGTCPKHPEGRDDR